MEVDAHRREESAPAMKDRLDTNAFSVSEMNIYRKQLLPFEKLLWLNEIRNDLKDEGTIILYCLGNRYSAPYYINIIQIGLYEPRSITLKVIP